MGVISESPAFSKSPALSVTSAPASPAPAPLREVEAGIFAREDDAAPLFRYRRIEKPVVSGTLSLEAEFRDAQGMLAVSEVYEKKGDEEVYRYRQHQTGESAEVRRKGKGVTYRFQDSDGKLHEDHEEATEDWVVGPSLVPRLQAGWARILRGEPVPVRIAVPDRRESFGFVFRPDLSARDKNLGAESVRVWLEPRSAFLRLLVSPIEFWLSADGTRVHKVRGRTLLKIKRGSRFEDLDAVTRFR